MFILISLLSYCVSQIIEVKFIQSKWEGEFQSSPNNTYRITQIEQQNLDEKNQDFMLLANKYQPISSPFSSNLKDGENIDLTNLYENRLERFLVIQSASGYTYITTISNIEGRTYKIVIKKIQVGCLMDAKTNAINKDINYKCYCEQGYIGLDCKYFATEMKDSDLFQPNFTRGNDFALMSFPINLFYEGQKYIFKFQVILTQIYVICMKFLKTKNYNLISQCMRQWTCIKRQNLELNLLIQIFSCKIQRSCLFLGVGQRRKKFKIELLIKFQYTLLYSFVAYQLQQFVKEFGKKKHKILLLISLALSKSTQKKNVAFAQPFSILLSIYQLYATIHFITNVQIYGCRREVINAQFVGRYLFLMKKISQIEDGYNLTAKINGLCNLDYQFYIQIISQ
ncbi:unnamed protein product [Paramecium octaurelia]|uniref:EGF-like domain-containing protein n=1 Tax=Paramecium octaurelia TaxID=43137 RepID=A0A8S1TL39_PAROT|nr:unnamed protein product [Paramecium octaurelia]